MIAKTEIEIVTGFLGSGKTTFINSLLKNTLVPGEIVLVLQGELGEKVINKNLLENGQVFASCLSSDEPFSEENLIKQIEYYRPNRIVIESNGTSYLSRLIELLSKKELRKLCSITSIFHTLEAETFELYLSNMEGFILPCIQNSNLIVINNLSKVSAEEGINIKNKLMKLNSFAVILGLQDSSLLESTMKNSLVFDRGILKRFRVAIKNLLNKRGRK